MEKVGAELCPAAADNRRRQGLGHACVREGERALKLNLVELMIAFSLLLAGCRNTRTGSGSAAPVGASAAELLGLRQVEDLPLPGEASRLDYQSLDPQAHRLYIAHLGASSVIVVDTERESVVGMIPDVSQVHGVLAVPDLKRVYASATGGNQIFTINATDLHIDARTAGGDYPDGLAYDPDDGKVFVSDEQGGTDTVISTTTNQRIAMIQLGGEAGNTQYDPGSHRILTAVQTRNQLVAIDPRGDRITQRYDLPGCKHPHGLLIDEPSRLAFIACDENATLLVFDLRSSRVTATQTVGGDPDVLAFDGGLHRLYVAAESGVLTIFRVQGTGVQKLAQGFLAPRAHTIAVDQETHRVFLPLENIDGMPVLRIMEPTDTNRR